MMRFKELITENIDEFFSECNPFINKNANQLSKGNYLLRGSRNSYPDNFNKRPFRKRKFIRGDTFRTFLYEKFRPSSFPSRQVMLPTQNKILYGSWDRLNTYAVFPIGNDYKIVFTDRMTDFNDDNPYLDRELMNLDLKELLYDYARNKSTYDTPSEIAEELRDKVNQFDSMISGKYSDILNAYNMLWETFNEIQDEIEWAPKHKKKILSGIKQFFNHSQSGKEVPKNSGLETNVYAPDGFYYVREEVLDDLVSKI